MLVIPEGTHGLACRPHTAPGTPGKRFSELQHGKWKWSTTNTMFESESDWCGLALVLPNSWSKRWQLSLIHLYSVWYTPIFAYLDYGHDPLDDYHAYLGDGLAYLHDGHVPLHDGQGHLPLLLGVLLHRRVHDQKTTYDYVVVKLKILETGEKADNKTSRHLILSQGR